MSRGPVQVRDATPDDAEPLLEILTHLARRTHSERFPAQSPAVEAATAVARIAADPDQRLIVGILEDRVVGVAHLTRGPVSPLHCEQAIHISHLRVLPDFRRHGVGHALVEATVRWAEEKDTGQVLAAVSATSRDANRFLARLGLTQVATVRRATVSALRARLPVETPAAARVGNTRSHRSVGQVLVHRRSLRRAQTKTSG